MTASTAAPEPPLARAARWAGPLLALAAFLAMPERWVDPAGVVQPLSHEARGTAAVAVWMAIWWLGEAIPIQATALLPLALFPLLGVRDLRAAAAPYAHELIFLFMGGFLLALSMERWQLHRRVALQVLRRVGVLLRTGRSFP